MGGNAELADIETVTDFFEPVAQNAEPITREATLVTPPSVAAHSSQAATASRPPVDATTAGHPWLVRTLPSRSCMCHDPGELVAVSPVSPSPALQRQRGRDRNPPLTAIAMFALLIRRAHGRGVLKVWFALQGSGRPPRRCVRPVHDWAHSPPTVCNSRW